MGELLRRLRAQPLLALELVVASFIINVLAMGTSLYVIQVLNRYVANGIDATLYTLTGGVLLAALLEYAFRQVRTRLAVGVSAAPDQDLSRSTFAALAGATAASLDALPAGHRREVVQGIATVQRAYGTSIVTSVLDTPWSLLYVFVIVLLSPLIAGVVFACVALVLLGTLLGQSALNQASRRQLAATSRVNAVLGTALAAKDAVRAFNGRAALQRQWDVTEAHAETIRRQLVAQQSATQSMARTASALMSTLVIALGAKLVVSGDLTTGAMIGANILAGRALAPLLRLAELGSLFAQAASSLHLLQEVAALPRERQGGVKPVKLLGRIEFKNLGMQFPNGLQPLFQSLDGCLEPGSATMIAGGNGVGKTTLSRLLVGLLEPTEGQVLVDGVDLRCLDLAWWRRRVVYLPQEPVFFDGTVRLNLRVARPGLDDDRLRRILSAAGIREGVGDHPIGLDTVLVNGGADLSVGIRRRLALARGLATGGRVVILDDPLEGLDGKGRLLVTKLLRLLRHQGRTVIVLSHVRNLLPAPDLLIDLNNKPVPSVVAGQPKQQVANHG